MDTDGPDDMQMNVMTMARFGGPDVFEAAVAPLPEPGPGDVRVRVHASGVNFAETMQRSGSYPGPETLLPAVLGSEAAGVVDALGAGVEDVAVGDRVAAPLFASMRLTGGYAEQVVVPSVHAVPIPDGLGFAEATAVTVQGTTAWLMLREVPCKGRRVLATAAAGGVGAMIVQFARLRGATAVIGAASGDKLERVRALEVDAALDYRTDGWTHALASEAAPDLIYDAVGGSIGRTALAALAPGGTFVTYGALSGEILTLDQVAMGGVIFANQSLRGFANYALLSDEVIREALTELFDLAATRRIQARVGGRYPLAEVGRAHADLEARRTSGKLVLIPEGVEA
ncbi:MAG: zinc-binding dehydrogenase [Pseudomonadota bacterium]